MVVSTARFAEPRVGDKRPGYIAVHDGGGRDVRRTRGRGAEGRDEDPARSVSKVGTRRRKVKKERSRSARVDDSDMITLLTGS